MKLRLLPARTLDIKGEQGRNLVSDNSKDNLRGKFRKRLIALFYL